MKTIKIADLTALQLDWAVAKCEVAEPVGSFLDGVVPHPDYNNFHPSTAWHQGGPIIEREITKVFRNVGGTWSAMILTDVPIPVEDRGTSFALTRRAQWNGAGPTPLIAAMRCYCYAKLGEFVDIPEELL